MKPNLTSGVSVYYLTQIGWALSLKVTKTAAAGLLALDVGWSLLILQRWIVGVQALKETLLK